MKRFKFLVSAIIALCIFSGANAQTSKDTAQKKEKHAHITTYQCPMKCEGAKTYAQEGKCPVCGMKLKAIAKEHATTAIYQCPMKCEGDKTYDKAGKCPVCNMNLKEVTAKVKTTDQPHQHDHN